MTGSGESIASYVTAMTEKRRVAFMNSTLAYLTPVEFEEQYIQQQSTAA